MIVLNNKIDQKNGIKNLHTFKTHLKIDSTRYNQLKCMVQLKHCTFVHCTFVKH